VTKSFCVVALMASLVACSSITTEIAEGSDCSEIAVYQYPPHADNLFRVLVTQIGEQAQPSLPIYQLTPGSYDIRVVELIDDPRLDVPERQRGYRDMTLELKAGVRYHLVAQFDPQNFAHPERYWSPMLWRESKASCSVSVQ
jgi:hypothetical protein